MSTQSPALPQEELRRLENAIGKPCVALRLCHMRDADIEFDDAQQSGLHELTWGVLIDLADVAPLCVTWTQDAYGNPNRLSLAEAASVHAIDSVVVQDVSRHRPWRSLLGTPCQAIRSHTYRSNYSHRPSDTWHDVLWGLEFHFAALTFLVAAALHGHALSDPIVNDELVVAYTPRSIAQMVALRANYVEEWRTL
jgi:hypothetical protein